MAAVFDRAAAVYDTAIPFFARFGERLVEVAGVGPGEKVIDIASGRGASLIPAAIATGREGRVLGIDAAPAMVAALTSDVAARGLPGVTVRVGDAMALQVDDESFDVALCGFTIMLLPDPVGACAEMHRVLRPGGRVAMSMPTGAGPEWGFFSEVAMQFLDRLTTLPPAPPAAPELDGVLASAGFVAIELLDETEDFAFADEDTWWRWVWSQGMRVFLEALPDDALEEFRAAAYERLQPLKTPAGIPLRQRVRYAIGVRSAT